MAFPAQEWLPQEPQECGGKDEEEVEDGWTTQGTPLGGGHRERGDAGVP